MDTSAPTPPTAATPRTAPATTTPGTAPAPTLPGVEPDERLQEGDPGDHDRFTHYVRKRDLERSRRTGKPVRAMCGKRWIPDGDPSRYPMCPTCADIVAEAMTRGLS
jgi:hypothetical protein